jgi:hypothetical protein
MVLSMGALSNSRWRRKDSFKGGARRGDPSGASVGDVGAEVTGRPFSCGDGGSGNKPGGGSRCGSGWSDPERDLVKRLEVMLLVDRLLSSPLDTEDFEGLRATFCTAGGGLTMNGAGRWTQVTCGTALPFSDKGESPFSGSEVTASDHRTLSAG